MGFFEKSKPDIEESPEKNYTEAFEALRGLTEKLRRLNDEQRTELASDWSGTGSFDENAKTVVEFAELLKKHF